MRPHSPRIMRAELPFSKASHSPVRRSELGVAVQHWLFSIGPNGGSGGKSYPPYNQDPGTLTPATAKLITSDYGRPKGNMTVVSTDAAGTKFQRVYEKATVTLDCATFTGTFAEHDEQ